MDIRVENLQAVLGGTQILRGVELQVGQRELVGVIGPNGSGKSTLLKCIYRVLKPSGGAVYLDGKDLEDYSFKQSARRVAVVAQHNYYNFDFTVQDVVLMGRAPHKRALERDNARDYQLVAQALETVGMAAFAGRSFSTLSGGEQQRVILARALAQDTPCLILDEPHQPPGHQIPAPAHGHRQGPGPDGGRRHPRSEHRRHVLRPALRPQGRGDRGRGHPRGGAHPGLHPAGV